MKYKLPIPPLLLSLIPTLADVRQTVLVERLDIYLNGSRSASRLGVQGTIFSAAAQFAGTDHHTSVADFRVIYWRSSNLSENVFEYSIYRHRMLW